MNNDSSGQVCELVWYTNPCFEAEFIMHTSFWLSCCMISPLLLCGASLAWLGLDERDSTKYLELAPRSYSTIGCPFLDSRVGMEYRAVSRALKWCLLR